MTPSTATPTTASLTARRPELAADRLLAERVPPRHFAHESFATYRPDPAYPSQQVALDRLRAVAAELSDGSGGFGRFGGSGGFVGFGRFGGSGGSGGSGGHGGFGAAGRSGGGLRWFRRTAAQAPTVYLDGGFGVGKTHLLASLASAVGPQGAAYGTFVEYTNLVGALGFRPTVDALAKRRLVCIDEFELDDPGDTVLMSRLLRELTDRGVALAATSNTLPESLGEGRFAADDFLREIQDLAGRFEVLRIDGQDYRQRTTITDAPGLDDDAVRAAVAGVPGATLDDFRELLTHLATVHPSRYGALLDGVDLVGLTGVGPAPDQDVALRLVVLVDRLYDRDVPVLLGGAGEAALFSAEMRAGGYRKKYFRALSRLGTLAERGRAEAAART